MKSETYRVGNVIRKPVSNLLLTKMSSRDNRQADDRHTHTHQTQTSKTFLNFDVILK